MIAIEGLSKVYGSDVAVDDVSRFIGAGALTVIVGASGAGKSTLMRMVNRLVEPTSGRVLIEDVRSGEWGIGGRAMTTADVKALATGTFKG